MKSISDVWYVQKAAPVCFNNHTERLFNAFFMILKDIRFPRFYVPYQVYAAR